MLGDLKSDLVKSIAIHGIRDYGEWQYRFVAKFDNSEIFRYEEFWLERFLFEFMHSSEISNRIARRIRSLCDINTINVICHSYGTHLLIKALTDNDDISVNNVVFCGAIARPDWRLDLICARKQIRGKIYNFAGTRDIWPPCASLLSKKFFPTGVNGIGHHVAVNVYEPVGHGAFLSEALWEKYKWNDLFQGAALPATPVSKKSILVDKILWFGTHRWILFSILASLAAIIWIFIAKAHPWVCAIRECSYNVERRIQYRQEPVASGSPLVVQENLSIYKFDYSPGKIELGAVSNPAGEMISFYDILGDHRLLSKIDEFSSLRSNDTTSYFPLTLVNRQAIAITWTRWIKSDSERYPGGVDLAARRQLKNIRFTVQVPQYVELHPYDFKKHLNAVFRYKLGKDRNEFLEPELIRDDCHMMKDAIGAMPKHTVEIECNNINIKPGYAFRYCFSLFNWDSSKLFTRTNDCLSLMTATGGALPPIPEPLPSP